MRPLETRTAILDAAESLVRVRGYNGFSYRDLAATVGIKTASIHYHFPTKGGLGEALVARERADWAAALTGIDAREKDPRQRLRRFIEHFQRTTLLCDYRMCLGAMLAVEQETLPEGIAAAVQELFKQNETWLAKLLEDGRKQGSFHFVGPSDAAARSIFSSLEGALLTARSFRDVHRFDAATRWIMQSLKS